MKKIVFSLAIMFVFASCSKVEKGQYLLAGTAKGVQNGKKVVIKKQTETGITISLDSTKVKDGKFEVKGKFTEPEMYAVFVEGLQQPVPFIVENDEIKITIDKDSIWKSKIGGTNYNDKFQQFNEKSNEVNKKLVEFQNKNMQAFMAAQQSQDTVAMNKLRKGYDAIAKELKDYYETYPDKNGDSYISLLMLQSKFSSPDFNLEKTKKAYDNLDSELKNTKIGKGIADKIKVIEKTQKAAPAKK